MGSKETVEPRSREWIARGFTLVEDIVYIGLGLLLSGIVIDLLVTGFISFFHSVRAGSVPTTIIMLLDRSLLILLVVEILYTVQVSFREHALLPEPFLLVGLISAIRRVLVITAEFGESQDHNALETRSVVIQLSVLTALILVLAISLVLLKRSGSKPIAERA